MEDQQESFLIWSAGATKKERGRFLKRYLDLLPDDELNGIKNLASKAKRRRRKRVIEPVPTVNESVPVPACPVVPLLVPWWKRWKKANVVSLDVEKVEVPNPSGKPKFLQKAAQVSVVNSSYEVLFSKMIQFKPGSFRVNPHNKTGFSRASLKDGTPLSEVQEQLSQVLNGKLVVMVAAEGDFNSLDMPIADYDVVDLQWNWYHEYTSSRGKPIIEYISLRSLCKHFFYIDMQPETIPHSAEVDASWTMSLFLDVYVNQKDDVTTRGNEYPSPEIKSFHKLYPISR